MLIIPAGVKVHLALGYTDMRKGLDGLAILVQETLKKDPFSGHLFAFRGRKAAIMKVLFWDGNGLCLFTKKLNQGGFVWPRLMLRRALRVIEAAISILRRGAAAAVERPFLEVVGMVENAPAVLAEFGSRTHPAHVVEGAFLEAKEACCFFDSKKGGV